MSIDDCDFFNSEIENKFRIDSPLTDLENFEGESLMEFDGISFSFLNYIQLQLKVSTFII